MNTVLNRVEVSIPVEELFSFYADPQNLVAMTPAAVNMRLLKVEGAIGPGCRITLSAKPSKVPFEVQVILGIEAYEAPNRFVDKIVKGPFDKWETEHLFEALPGGGSAVTDRITFGSPKGMASLLLTTEMIKRGLGELFDFRTRFLHGKFGTPGKK